MDTVSVKLSFCYTEKGKNRYVASCRRQDESNGVRYFAVPFTCKNWIDLQNQSLDNEVESIWSATTITVSNLKAV